MTSPGAVFEYGQTSRYGRTYIWPDAFEQVDVGRFMLSFGEDKREYLVNEVDHVLGAGAQGVVKRIAPVNKAVIFRKMPEGNIKSETPPSYAVKTFRNPEGESASQEAEWIHSGAVDDAMVPAVIYPGPYVVMQLAVSLDWVLRDVSVDRVVLANAISTSIMQLQFRLLKHGVYYSDAKPDNIAMIPSGTTGQLKMIFIDYGGLCLMQSGECPFSVGYVPSVMWKQRRWGFDSLEEAMVHLQEVADKIGNEIVNAL